MTQIESKRLKLRSFFSGLVNICCLHFLAYKLTVKGGFLEIKLAVLFWGNHHATTEPTLTKFLPENTQGHFHHGVSMSHLSEMEADLYSVGGNPPQSFKGNTSLSPLWFHFSDKGLPSLCTINIRKGKTCGGCLVVCVALYVPGCFLISLTSACWAPEATLLPQLPTVKSIARQTFARGSLAWKVDYTSVPENDIHKSVVTVQQIDLG